jgi:competence ComEA-like helix-hairpin-helix protein
VVKRAEQATNGGEPAAPDAVVGPAPELPPEPAPELGAERLPEVPPEVPPKSVPELPFEVAPEIRAERLPEIPPEPAPELPSEPAPEIRLGFERDPVDVNTADIPKLATLPGVGPKAAARIVAEREAGGPFRSLDDLERVEGFDSARIRRLAGRARP